MNGFQLFPVVDHHHVHSGFIPGHEQVQLLEHLVAHIARILDNQVFAGELVRQDQNALLVKLLAGDLGRLILDSQLPVNLFQGVDGKGKAFVGILGFNHQMVGNTGCNRRIVVGSVVRLQAAQIF